MLFEAEDGYDTIEWIASQKWCDGNVGMSSGSYEGIVQWLAASLNPPHLRAIAPVMSPSNYHESLCYRGGALELGCLLSYAFQMTAGVMAKKDKKGELEEGQLKDFLGAAGAMDKNYKFRPIFEQPEMRKHCDWYIDMLAHPDYDEYWKRWSNTEMFGKIKTPVFQIGGWFDIFIGGTVENYTGLYGEGKTGNAENRILIGPWSHGNYFGFFYDTYFGPEATGGAIGTDRRLMEFYDYWLKGKEPPEEPPVQVFIMGENKWAGYEKWPPDDTEPLVMYLISGGGAQSSAGDGALVKETTTCAEIDRYVHDPADPVPTVGGPTLLGLNLAGPVDLTAVEKRRDLLIYTGVYLEKPLQVMGCAGLELFASTSANDADWIVRLVDVRADGKSVPVTDGILRARYRGSAGKPEPVAPGEIIKYDICMWPTAYTFLPGHRVRLEIASSSYPRFDVNTGSGNLAAKDGADAFVLAENRVYHKPGKQSRIILPVGNGS